MMIRGAAHRATGANPSDLRRHNRALVLQTVWEQGKISRAELSRATRISGVVITGIVTELLSSKFVREDGLQLSSGGRPATVLRIAEQSWSIVGVDLARHRTRVAVADLNARVIHELSVPTSDLADGQSNLRWLQGVIAGALADAAVDADRLLGIGVGAPGPLHTTTGEILAPTNFGRWQRLPLRTALETHFRVPVRVDNDANACALAQHFLGAGRHVRNFVYFAAGSGVGAGLVLNGELYRGEHDLAGEIGHATIEPGGPPCPCGNRGCLELYTTVRATLARWQRDHPPGLPLNEVAEIGALIANARDGDPGALDALAATARYLSIGVINAINAYDPSVVFIGRELGAAGDLLLDPIRDAVARRAFPTTGRSVRIEADPLGEETPLLGAICLVLRELFLDTTLLSNLMPRSRLAAEGNHTARPHVASRTP